MPRDKRFAFMQRIDAAYPPETFADLTELARHIETKRRGQGIRLETVSDLLLYSPGDDGCATDKARRGVKVVTQLLDGGDDRVMGFAWLDDHDAEVLEHALRKVRSDAAAQPVRKPARRRAA